MKRMIKASTSIWNHFGDINPLEGAVYLRKQADSDYGYDVVGVYPAIGMETYLDSDEDYYYCWLGYADVDDFVEGGWGYRDYLDNGNAINMIAEGILGGEYAVEEFQPTFYGSINADGINVCTEQEAMDALKSLGIK